MKIVVCYKSVPNSDSISVNRDLSIDLSSAEWEIGQYDLRAIEAGMKLAAQSEDSTVCALTVGGNIVGNSKLKKAVLSRGPAEMYGVQDPSLAGADSLTSAEVLAAAIAKLGQVDLVLCGEGSGDAYAQQVGNMLGGTLGWTTVNGVSAVSPCDGGLRLERTLGDGVEVLELSLPAVISVTGDINTPRIPTMKDILGAGKKPAVIWPLESLSVGLCPASETISVLAPEQSERKKLIFDASQDGAVSEFAAQLAKAL